MPFSITPTRVEDPHFGWFDGSEAAETVRRVVEASAREDGEDPLDEATLLALRHGLGSSSMWVADSGFAWRHERSLDLVVDPSARGHGVGTALADLATRDEGPLTAWSHGNHPAAAALASRLGFDRVRDLWVMRRSLSSLPAPSARDVDGVDVRTFRVGEDDDAFLALNAKAFADHPEQGGLTREGLDERIDESWFDPAGFFVAVRDGKLVGFHWTKVHGDATPPFGEVYVVGVSPTEQGSGLGKRLTLTGLHHLADQGLEQVILYVESDNAPAIAVYERLGFTHASSDTHVQYARPR